MNFPFIHHHNHALKKRRQILNDANAAPACQTSTMLIQPSLPSAVCPKAVPKEELSRRQTLCRGVTPSPPVSPREDRSFAKYVPVESLCVLENIEVPVESKRSSCRYCQVLFERDEEAIQHEDFYCPSDPQSLFGHSSPFDDEEPVTLLHSSKRRIQSTNIKEQSSCGPSSDSNEQEDGLWVEHSPKRFRGTSSPPTICASLFIGKEEATKNTEVCPAVRRVSLNEAGHYNTCLMIQRGTLGILVRRNDLDEMMFDGYKDEISLNKARKAIRKVGDIFLEIEGQSLLGKSFEEAKALLLDCCKDPSRHFLNVRLQNVCSK